MGRVPIWIACVLLLAATCQGKGAPGHRVRVGYYNRKCPAAEIIVRSVVGKAVSRNPGLGAGIIRMAFHDCFVQSVDHVINIRLVQGCDASVLLDPTPANPRPEKLGPPNFPSLRGFEVIDAAKAVLERVCPGVVSCADVIAFAARDSAYFHRLQDAGGARKCPVSPNFTNDPTVVQDIVTPNRMDNKYYTNLLKRNVLFTSDAALLTSGKTALKVMENAFKPGSWEKKFAKAMVKMAAIELKTAANGEIRRNCRVVNN
uniref:Peroxidase 2 n=1 Tax=Aegilops tauschii TaxID=37682 RepID=M8BFW9_AEGTA